MKMTGKRRDEGQTGERQAQKSNFWSQRKIQTKRRKSKKEKVKGRQGIGGVHHVVVGSG